MLKFLITAASSNSGKTAVTCGLLSLLKRKGYDPCAFKCGPDYIDPMFHRSVLGIESANLDVFLAGEEGVREAFARGWQGHDAAVCEGVMGFYDGMTSGGTRASAWHVASLLEIPAILVVRPKGAALTLAAVIQGMAGFRRPSRIFGLVKPLQPPIIASGFSLKNGRIKKESTEHESSKSKCYRKQK